MLAVKLEPPNPLPDWLSKYLLLLMQCANHLLVLTCLNCKYIPDLKLGLQNLTGYKHNLGLVSISRAIHSPQMGMSLFAEIIYVKFSISVENSDHERNEIIMSEI